MKGMLGLGLVALGIFVGVLGGFLLNAETVTTCETEWTYVTDVGGAFVGDTSDLDEAYDPPANATGWSYLDQYNEGRISAVDYKTTDRTNIWRITTGSVRTAQGSISVVADDYSGNRVDPQVTVTSLNGGGVYNGDMSEGFGLHNSEAVTMFVHGGQSEAGAFGIPLRLVLDSVVGYRDMESVALTVTASGGYPAFAKVSVSHGVSVYRHSGSSYNVASETFTAISSDPVVKVFRAEGRAEIAGTAYLISEVLLVWGQAQFDASGPYVSTASVSYVGTLAAPTSYMDATKGVAPQEGSYTTEEVVFTHHDGSSHPSLEIDVMLSRGGRPIIEATPKAVVDIEWSDGSSERSVLVCELVMGTARWDATATLQNGTPVQLSGDGGDVSVTVSIESGTMTVAVGGQTAGTASATPPIAGATVSAFRLSMSGMGGTSLPDFEARAVADDGSAQERRYTMGGASDVWNGSTAYDTYETQSTSHPYSRAYWQNGFDNSELRMVFAAVDGDMRLDQSEAYRNALAFRGYNSALAVEVAFDPASGWSVSDVPVGMWPAIELTVGDGKVVSRPVQRFGTFADYDVMDVPTTVHSGLFVPEVVQGINAACAEQGYSDLRMAVTSTVTRIANGGLFLQDATLSVARSFPDSDAVSIMLGSAARMGSSITFASASAGTTASYPVDPDKVRIYIGGGWQPFNGVTFRWISADYGSVSIGGQSYGAAIYSNGQSYESGKLWAQLKNGRMYEVMDAGDDWTVTLDGIWAPATFLYEGQNMASQKTELADWSKPSFQWSKDDFLIIMMGVSIVGGLAGSYFRLVDLWDWMAIIGTVGCLWLFLG